MTLADEIYGIPVLQLTIGYNRLLSVRKLDGKEQLYIEWNPENQGTISVSIGEFTKERITEIQSNLERLKALAS